MVKKHTSKSNAQRCKEYRQRQKIKKDTIEQQLDSHVAELKQPKEEKKFNLVNELLKIDANSLEPCRDLRNQYQPNSNDGHFDLYSGKTEGIENPLDKVSHADNLRKLFGDNHAE
jgi:hypothetical protein